MAIRYKNPQTGEYEVIKIPVMKGEQGHAGIHVGTDAPPTTDVKLWFDPSDTDNDVDLANRLDTTLTACYDYMGNDRGSIKAAADANVDWLLGEINTVHYDGQHITATDTIEGRSKSAILKGQTLVNVIDEIWFPSNANHYFFVDLKQYEINKDYLFMIFNAPQEITEVYVGNGASTIVWRGYARDFVRNGSTISLKVTCPSNYDGSAILPHIRYGSSKPSLDEVKQMKAMLIPYQQGMENWDIPYFEGMASVKAPVLKSVGKNLFDGILKQGYIGDNTGEANTSKAGVYSPNYMRVKPNTTYIRTISGSYPSGVEGRVYFYDINKTYLGTYKKGATFITPENAQYIRFRYYIGNGEITPNDFSESNIQIEEGSAATPYEPYKSNILSTPEDLELRRIGNVRDELNCLTGELTERIGEIVLDGSDDEKWTIQTSSNGTGKYFALDADRNTPNILKSVNVKGICDKIPYVSYSVIDDGGFGFNISYGIRLHIQEVNIYNGATLTDLSTYLQQNPITIQYQLNTESIKTVDLSDNHVYSYKDTTHYTCSSEDGSLIPTLSIDVPTNLSALVTKQRQQIRTLEEENQILSDELQLAIASSEENDNELLAQSFELDFRLMEVECALDLPMAATFRLGGKTMAMTPYEMAKKLILADNYDRADMEHKLDVYVSKKRMTEAERQELIQLMDEKEGIISIDPVEPEVEESVIEHEAVTIPLH